jgi:kynureninase
MENLDFFRKKSLELDKTDPLNNYKNYFCSESDLIYFDGNSLGRLPKSTIDQTTELIKNQWGKELIQSWNKHWFKLISDTTVHLSKMFQCNPSELFIGESTSNNLYKVIDSLAASKKFKTVITDSLNFPSDIYVIEEICSRNNLRFEFLKYKTDIECEIDLLKNIIQNNPNSIISLSLVSYKSSYCYPYKALNELCEKNNCELVWDLSHAAGALDLNFEKDKFTFAVGCTYKFLNGGPGSPAFIYVSEKKIKKIKSPIRGWFGHSKPFDFNFQYEQSDSMEKFRSGTPHILSLSTLPSALLITNKASISEIDFKRKKMIKYFLELFDKFLVNRGFIYESPSIKEIGSHISISHNESWRICKSLIKPKSGNKFIVDYRPDRFLRIAITPLYSSYHDLYLFVERLMIIIDKNEYLIHDNSKNIVP